MAKEHRRSSEIVRQGVAHNSGYRASIAKLESERSASLIANVLDWLTIPSGITGFEPRYRVLVGTGNDERSVGVAEARTLRRAERRFNEVDHTLAIRSRDEVKAAFDLDF